jgi:uncharacterized protein
MTGRRPSRRPAARRVAVAVLVVTLALVVFVGLSWALQRRIIYFPDPSTPPSAAEVFPGGRDVTLTTSDGLALTAWFAPPTAADRQQAVLLAPGNGGNRAGRAGLARHLTDRGFAVLLLDYRGYGGNPGSPTENGLHADALAAVDTLTDLGYPPDATIYLGESLGTGVVAALTAERPPAGMVLRSPFTSLGDVGRHHYPFLPVDLLLSDRFPVLEHVEQAEVPVTVVYGDSDDIVPSELSSRVAAAAPALVEELVLPGAGHNDPVMFGPEVAAAVARLADTLPGHRN